MLLLTAKECQAAVPLILIQSFGHLRVLLSRIVNLDIHIHILWFRHAFGIVPILLRSWWLLVLLLSSQLLFFLCIFKKTIDSLMNGYVIIVTSVVVVSHLTMTRLHIKCSIFLPFGLLGRDDSSIRIHEMFIRLREAQTFLFLARRLLWPI